MYGTVARIKAKPGQEKALAAILEEWRNTRGNKVKGVVASYPYQLDKGGGEMLMVAVFQDKATYAANAEDPEQDRWYQRFRAMLSADPIWEDGEILSGGGVR